MNIPPEIEEFLDKYDRLLLDSKGIIKLQPAEFYHHIDNTKLRVWAICRAIYQLPTVELSDRALSNRLHSISNFEARNKIVSSSDGRIQGRIFFILTGKKTANFSIGIWMAKVSN